MTHYQLPRFLILPHVPSERRGGTHGRYKLVLVRQYLPLGGSQILGQLRPHTISSEPSYSKNSLPSSASLHFTIMIWRILRYYITLFILSLPQNHGGLANMCHFAFNTPNSISTSFRAASRDCVHQILLPYYWFRDCLDAHRPLRENPICQPVRYTALHAGNYVLDRSMVRSTAYLVEERRCITNVDVLQTSREAETQVPYPQRLIRNGL